MARPSPLAPVRSISASRLRISPGCSERATSNAASTDVRWIGRPLRLSRSRAGSNTTSPIRYLLRLGRGVFRPAAQDAADAQQQFARFERLGQVVVGAGLEAGNAVVGFAHRRQHQNRHAAAGPQIGGEIEPAFARHHQVEDDQVEGQTAQLGAGVGGIRGGRDHEAVLRQELAQQLPQTVVVVHHQDMRKFRFHAASAFLPPAPPGPTLFAA